MIKASELRIGNWVLWNGLQYQVTEIGRHEVNIGDDLLVVYTDLEVVMLSPEVFAKCNIPDAVAPFIKLYDRHTPDENLYQVYYTVSHQHKILGFVIHLNHLHHLQNLVYELTGTELNYTP